MFLNRECELSHDVECLQGQPRELIHTHIRSRTLRPLIHEITGYDCLPGYVFQPNWGHTNPRVVNHMKLRLCKGVGDRRRVLLMSRSKVRAIWWKKRQYTYAVLDPKISRLAHLPSKRYMLILLPVSDERFETSRANNLEEGRGIFLDKIYGEER